MSKNQPSIPAQGGSGRDEKVATCARRLRDIAINQSPLVCLSELDRISETAAPGHADKVAASLGLSSEQSDDGGDSDDSDEPEDTDESGDHAFSKADWNAQETQLARIIFPEAA